jgi:hypothetical protein
MEVFALVDKEGFLVSYHQYWPRLAAGNQGHYQEYVVEAEPLILIVRTTRFEDIYMQAIEIERWNQARHKK